VPAPILATKLYIPPSRRRVVVRPRLIERLNEGLVAGTKLTLVSAPAGFGKTTLIGEWVAGCGRPVAWLSLDEGDSDPRRFLTYLIAALQTVAPGIGEGILTVLRSPQPPPIESTLTALLNDITTIPSDVVLVLDDYHVLDAKPVDDALAFLVEHLPSQMHLVIATREDPALPLARLRARGQLTELRAADLRFTPSEAAGFLHEVMNLDLSAEEVAALDARTEGWIAGLQLAAISLQGRPDVAGFIASFAGSHHFVLDYLLEEVLQRQPDSVQAFLLRTSILDRLCGPLCDAVLLDASASGQETLEYLDRANLFIVPLDTERRWYRYHHLFADLLRQRRQLIAVSSGGVDEDHLRASDWFEANDLEIEAFQHAAAGHDVERAERLIEGGGMPLYFRGALVPILHWLGSLPTTVLDTRPSLWVTYAQALLSSGQNTGIEPKLQAAERALQETRTDDRTRDLVGRIASVRAFLVWSPHQVETIIAQSLRALEYLHPDNLPFRTAAALNLGHAYVLLGDRSGARQALTEVTAISAASGNTIYEILGSIGLGYIQETDNQLDLAVETFQHAVELAAGLPFPFVCEAHLGLARVLYQWNDLDAARQHGEQSLQLARQIANTDRPVACEVLLARLALARGDAAGAAASLAEADQAARQHDFVLQVPEVAAAREAPAESAPMPEPEGPEPEPEIPVPEPGPAPPPEGPSIEKPETEAVAPAAGETAAAEPGDGRQWYVLHCYSGYENKVRHAIEQRIETMGMRDKIFDVVIPTEEEIEVKDGKRRTVESRVFPGYILVQMILNDDSWYVVRNTPGVTGFAGMGNTPTPLRPEEVHQIIKRMEAEAPKVKVTYKSGQKVRIIDGPFNDFIGTVDAIDVDRAKVRVMVSFFGRETPVELDLLQVEKT